jgi:hypothetical protein
MMVPVDLPSVTQALHLLCKGSIVGDHGAAIAQRAEILRRIKAERPGVANGPDRAAVCRRQMGLTAVFDDREVVPRGEAFDREHVRCLPVQVDWNDRTGAWSNDRGNRIRVNRQTNRIHIGEHRSRTRH